MKLIIDIDENIFTRLFDCVDGGELSLSHADLDRLETAVRSGAPYEKIEGDLISRNTLKDIVRSELADDGYGVRRFIGIIDNVSAVVPEEFMNSYQEGYDLARKEFERPEGEWIDTGSGQECSQCHEIQYGYDNFRHFCANCGVKMKHGDSDIQKSCYTCKYKAGCPKSEVCQECRGFNHYERAV